MITHLDYSLSIIKSAKSRHLPPRPLAGVCFFMEDSGTFGWVEGSCGCMCFGNDEILLLRRGGSGVGGIGGKSLIHASIIARLMASGSGIVGELGFVLDCCRARIRS